MYYRVRQQGDGGAVSGTLGLINRRFHSIEVPVNIIEQRRVLSGRCRVDRTETTGFDCPAAYFLRTSTGQKGHMHRMHSNRRAVSSRRPWPEEVQGYADEVDDRLIGQKERDGETDRRCGSSRAGGAGRE